MHHLCKYLGSLQCGNTGISTVEIMPSIGVEEDTIYLSLLVPGNGGFQSLCPGALRFTVLYKSQKPYVIISGIFKCMTYFSVRLHSFLLHVLIQLYGVT